MAFVKNGQAVSLGVVKVAVEEEQPKDKKPASNQTTEAK